MRRSFNTAGPCIPGEHYMVPPGRRLGRVLRLIDERKFFTLTAGRQTGKTTSAKWLVEHLNATGQWCAMHVDVQTARDTDSPFAVFKVIREKLDQAIKRDLPDIAMPKGDARLLNPYRTFLVRYLQDLAQRAPHPLVILFDEADALMGRAMVSFLTQLRDGYIARDKTPFPASAVLIGQRGGTYLRIGPRPPMVDQCDGGSNRRSRRRRSSGRDYGRSRGSREGDDHHRAS